MRMEQHQINKPEIIANPFAQSLRRRILVVEDDKTHRSLMKKIVEQCQCNVTLAEDGLAALAKLESKQIFDLIVMDWDMPKLDGLETVRIIRSRQADRKIPYIPVIAFTAKRAPGDGEKCLAAGMDGYLPKDIWMPHWRQSLIDILQGLISGSFDVQDFKEEPEKQKGVRMDFDLDAFDNFAFDQAQSLLKGDFAVAVEEYLEDASAYIAGIRKGLAAGDFKQIEINSHPLKSNSKSFGLSAVSGIAESINSITRDPMKTREKMRLLEDLVPKIEEAFKRAEKRLQTSVQGRSTTTS